MLPATSSFALRCLLNRPSVASQFSRSLALLSSTANNKRFDAPKSDCKNALLLQRRLMPQSAIISQSSASSALPSDHSNMFKIERFWAAGMTPLFPLAFFWHGPVIDFALAMALGMHIHWSLHGVVSDYARPFVIGETLAKAAHYALYVFSALMFAGFLSFNYNDVGITRAFEMLWEL